MTIESAFLESTKKLLRYYKTRGDKSFEQLDDAEVLTQPNDTSNSIALIVHHLSGNMLSRFTDFLTNDGEKPWRDRDAEFAQSYADERAVLVAWESGWACLFRALDELRPEDLARVVYIRNEGHTVLEALQRQLAHYPYHIGQIVYAAKLAKAGAFRSLSIPKNASAAFNARMFEREAPRRHFTDETK